MSEFKSQKLTEWRERLNRFGDSNQTVSEFCRREKVSEGTFYQWRRRFAESAAIPNSGFQTTTNPPFVPIEVTSGPTELEVIFPNGARLRLPAHNHEGLRVLIESIALARTTSGDQDDLVDNGSPRIPGGV